MSAPQTRTPTLLLIGCGDIGGQLGTKFLQRGWQVIGARRSTSQLPKGFQGQSIDFSRPDTLAALGEVRADYVLCTLTPSEISEAGYRAIFVDAFKATLANIHRESLQQLFFASSTSVYGQHNHEWITESSECQPRSYSGKAVLAAEQLLADSGLPHSICRFSGIYGPGRRRMLEIVERGQCAPEQPLQFSNRLHRDDCVGIVEHLILRHAAGESLDRVYLCSDELPVPIHEVHLWLSDKLGVKHQCNADYRHRTGSKRCDSSAIRNTGYTFRYPDFKKGYTQAFDLS